MPHAVSKKGDVHNSQICECLKKNCFFYNCCRVTPDGLELVKWEQEFLGVELIESQFPGAGVGVATSAATTIKKVKVHCCYKTYCVVNWGKKKKIKGALVAQYIGRYLVIPKSQTDHLFDPIFFQNHERLIQVGPVMQPIVYANHTSALQFTTVSIVLLFAPIHF